MVIALLFSPFDIKSLTWPSWFSHTNPFLSFQGVNFGHVCFEGDEVLGGNILLSIGCMVIEKLNAC